jgi:hypothetical protein
MPVMLLMADDVKRWLYGTAADALELQKPAPDAAIVVLPSEKRRHKSSLGGQCGHEQEVHRCPLMTEAV